MTNTTKIIGTHLVLGIISAVAIMSLAYLLNLRYTGLAICLVAGIALGNRTTNKLDGGGA